ncbi:MAG: exo-poly-alpha-D-galacturonosidase [Verrucomicrobia bacterium RIFCSPLOWO2_12_FULL_64_8]|nr:MAG: exo-poly-alpha-D-galacturonosidase [Verrucomicrobia bacterium RIFCSPLOWO2_12_FULL_64_8]
MTFVLCPAAPAQVPPRPFDVRAHGAVGDGTSLDTDAINRAIDAAAAAGGGTVYFSAGTYASYSIHLKSNVALYLDHGAVILAAEPSADLSRGYDAPEPNPGTDQYEDFGHAHWHNSLIWGEDLENVSILGPGKIYGRGLSRGTGGTRRDLLPEERRAGAQPDLAFPAVAREAIAAQTPGPFNYPGRDTLPAGVGNKSIALKNCRNVLLRDFTVYHGGHFALLAIGTDNFTIDNVRVDTNRDGFDIDSCRNVRIANCTVNSPDDDAICLKACFGLGRPRATENVTITNCQVSGFEEGTLLDGTCQPRPRGGTGRIKFGTEANGGFKNIAISNCVFDSCFGLALEEVDGGAMEDIAITNLTMRNIDNAPIFIRLGARLRGPPPIAVGAARRIIISNVVASNVAPNHGILISGVPGHTIDDVRLNHIFIEYRGGGTKDQAAREVPELEKDYPEPGRFGILPSYGMFARHVKGLSLHGVEVRHVADEQRPPFYLHDVTDAVFSHVKAPHAPGVPTFVLREVNGLTVRDCPGLPDTCRTDRVENERF